MEENKKSEESSNKNSVHEISFSQSHDNELSKTVKRMNQASPKKEQFLNNNSGYDLSFEKPK